jgi:hypothetical protein
MGNKRWLLPLITGLILTTCCCLVASGAGGLLVGAQLRASTGYSRSTVLQAPTAIPEVNRRPPTAAERDTARKVAEAELPQRDLNTLAQRLQGLEPPAPPPTMPIEYDLGDSQTFWLHDVNSNTFFTTTAKLAYQTPHAYWWVEEGYHISQSDLERSAQNFETGTYPTSRQAFGSEWTPGIDGDPHVYIFLGNVPGVGGYFSGPDEYSSQIRAYSNEHEMFYINLENASPGNDYFDGILAHEFQHMIHWAVDRDEASWVNEGLSELAAQLNGYDVGGSDVLFSQKPDTQLTTWPELGDSGPHYGASYLFLSYFLEQYGLEAIQRLVAHPANGTSGFNAVLQEVDPTGRSFEELFAEWTIANYLDSSLVAGKPYGYADLAVSKPAYAARHETYPVRQETTVHQYATDYIALEGEDDLRVEFTGSTIVPLVGNETHSGSYQWCSLRGDESDATLTRAFDLSGLDGATLEVWMWYDLETDYDYAYAMASIDGRQTWNLLSSKHTTTTNPSGNSYGPAFTGTSGAGEEATWVKETFDLSPYAGEQVWIRFEVITDDAVNRPGLCLDDISLPELKYEHDVEAGEDGWDAAGWLRVTDRIPQSFEVQVVTIGQDARRQRMILDGNQRGSLLIRGLGHEVKHVILVVSAFAPSTTELASYAYEITRGVDPLPASRWVPIILRPQLRSTSVQPE